MFHVQHFGAIGAENLARPPTVNCHKASKIARKIGTLGGSMAALLGGLAEFERELTRARAHEGGERAKARA
jgi:DNA invertase Pin-like site-specific DNA recombinase